MRDSKKFKLVKLAYRKGYRIRPDGQLENAMERILKCQKRGRYLSFNMCDPETGIRVPIPIHQLAAYQKFGEEAFEAAECVRHKNEDSLDNRPENILLGTHRDNAMDRDPIDRQQHARHASKSIQRKDWPEIDADRAAGVSYKQLEKKYGVSRGTLAYRYSKKAKYRRLENR